MAYFSFDATPPIGHPLCGGWIKPLEVVDAPLMGKGIILSDGRTRYVLCALDWCELRTASYDLMRRKMAEAAAVPESQVALQTVHPHNAPMADLRAQELIERETSPPAHLDVTFMHAVAGRAAAAVRQAADRLEPFTHIGYGKAKVEKFASTRRIPQPNGKVLVRSSSAKSATLHAAPEGRIDPWLRTVTFFNGSKPLVRLHYYASHPMSFYGDGRGSPDTPGWARAQLEAEEGIPHIYFTGCGGDVGAGKYNDGTPDARAALIERLVAGMKGAVAATTVTAATALVWKTAEVHFARRTEPEFSENHLRQVMADVQAPVARRLNAALALAFYERLAARPTIEISCLKIGPVRVIHLPGEPFVEYQIYAQSLKPDDFVAVAGYGDCGMGYICTDRAFAEGGYEPTVSLVGPPSEERLKSAIAQLLDGASNRH
ncbi:MAG: hypothetical protein N3D11_13780 [Candidatus Sumerlaeia bacterium]|nr:hypothetical protein [Candidatus Sumerlaeia bacterium]